MSIPNSIFNAYKEGKPLSSDQKRWVLSNSTKHRWLEDIAYYYRLTPRSEELFAAKKTLETKKNTETKKTPQSSSFIVPHGSFLSLTDFEIMKRRLQDMLADVDHGAEIHLTPPQFIMLRNIIPSAQFIHPEENTVEELLFYQGNQVLAGAPFFKGGIPRVDFFQWGNLMGVVKYEELLGEKGIEGNILIYFEDIQDRTLSQAIHDYLLHHLVIEPQLQPELAEPGAVPYPLRTELDPSTEPEPQPEPEEVTNTSSRPHLILQPPDFYPLY